MFGWRLPADVEVRQRSGEQIVQQPTAGRLKSLTAAFGPPRKWTMRECRFQGLTGGDSTL